jgi:hypothetical protein
MANFLDDLSSYNAKAALAISNAVAAGDTQKANMMSSLKSTANDETLSEAVRLNALTALVNLGSLLEIPLPPYFPMSVQYADIQTYEGIHNDLLGIQGGAPNEYYHLTFAERAAIASAASLADITWANLLGSYTDNNTFAALFDAKQAALSAPVGNYFVKIDGTTISYDNSVYLTSSTGLASGSAAGGELTGNYPNPTVQNSAVISKLLVGWNGSATNESVTSSDSILTGMQKLNARINAIVASPGGVSTVALSTNAPAIFDGTAAQTGVATVTLGLRNQSQNLFLASSSTLPNTQPTFRAIAVADLPTASGVTPTQYGSTTLIPQITVDSKGRITAIANVTAAAGGQVNSVTLSVPSGSIYSSNATGTATDPILNFSVQSQAPNTVYAGPASGVSNVVPSFRALVAADIANISIPQSQVTGLADTLSTFMTNSLANGTMYIGNTSDAAVNAAVAGDLTMAYVDNSGTNQANFTIANGAVTYAKIQNVTAETILGRYSATNGTVQQLTLDPSDFTINNSTGVIGLVTPNPPTLTTKGDLLTSNGTAQVRLGIGANATLFMADSAATTGNKWVAMSGDATIAVDGALTIANSAVTLGKMANLAANSIIGNNTGSPATPIALTATQATAMLDLFSTTTTTKGLVQGSNGADNTHFLRADNTWQPITGTGTVTSVDVDTDNGFAGTVADPTGDAIITLSTTVTGILKGNGTAMSAATAGTDYVAPGEVTTSGLTMVTARLLGRTTSGTAAIESISVNSSLSLASTTLGINLGNTNVFTAQQEMTAIKLNGSTSGYVSFTPPATAGTQNYTLPMATPGGAGEFLTATTGGVLSWASPAGSGTTTNAVTFNNGGSGDASGTTFDGSAARTISYNTIGAQALNANLTGLSGLTYVSGSPLIRMTAAGTFTLDGATYVTGTATQYAVLVGGASNTVASVTGGAAGQVLRYVSGANPAWSTATYPNTTSINRILYSSANNVVDEIVAPSDATFLRYTTAGGYSWQSAVTSLGFGTQGLITNGGTAAAPVLAVSGNSGGVVYFSNATTWASSGTLDQYELVVGGGAGSPPITINNSATAGTILTSNGNSNNPSWTAATYPTSTSINRILFSSANNVIDEIVAPNTADTFLKWDGTTFTWDTAGGGGGSGTVTSGGDKELAYYDSAGTTVQGLAVSPSNGTFILSQTITSGTPANPAWTAVTGTGDVVLATSPTIDTSFTATYATSDTLAQFDVSKNLVSATTGVGVITALGVPVGTAGAFVVNGGALGSPASGNFTTGTFTWPTFNQNTSGSAASLTTSRDIQTNLGSTSAAAFNGTANITPGVTGTLPVGNGGTGAPSLTAFAVLCGGTTATGAVQSIVSVGTAGQVLTSNGAGALPTFQTGGGSVALNSVLASTASATISHGNFTNTWNWNSNTTSNAFVFGSTSITTAALLAVSHTTSAYTGGGIVSFSSTGITSGNLLALGISGSAATSAENLVITNSSTANTSGRGLDISITEATASGNTFGAFISNTKTGATSTNTAISLTASGGTTNYALDVVAGISRFAAGTATTPQLILTPSTAAGGTTFTGTVNGSIWYDTNSSGTATSAFSVYKDTSITRLVTVARNPDFATGSGSGVVVADVNGTLSKSADLTALGIFSVHANTGNITTNATETTMIGTSLVGSTTLPANFFGVGKTVRIYASGTVDNANNDDTTIRFKLGGTTIGTFSIVDMHDTTANDFVMEAYIICNAAGASGTVRVGATFFVEGTTASGEHTWYMPVATQTGTINTTNALALDITNQWGQTTCTMVVNFMTCYYLN